MDTKALNRALRAATDDVAPRADFAADVLRGARRRRSRNRFTIGAVVIGTAAAAVAAMTVVPKDLAAPPPADRPTEFSMLDRSGGSLIADESVTRAAIAGWTDGIAGSAGAAAGISPADLLGEPHVYWAGNTTSITAAAIVAQAMRLPDGTRTVASGAVIDNPDDDRAELELISATPTPAAFLLPDNKTLLAPFPDGGQGLFVSAAITVNDEGRSVRPTWSSFDNYDGDTARVIGPAELPRPHNLRIAIGTTKGRDGHLPVRLNPTTPVLPNRGLPWIPFSVHLPEPRDLAGRPVWEAFQNGLRDSGLLDSYREGPPKWTVVADLPDGRTLVLSEYQELDNPAYAFSVLVRADGSVEDVTRVAEIDPAATAQVVAPAPDRQGTVVAAKGKQIAYRTSTDGSWEDLGDGAALVPSGASEIRVGTTVTPLD